ncbi:non-ribosomal peptide synthetase [Rippkaea orientalis]|nr:non-ribosomal peptide synthetase [Rippkaea orientalis]
MGEQNSITRIINDNSFEIEDMYELSPLQEGMLIHTLQDQGMGMYINQGVYKFEQLNLAALKSAWQQIVDRHTILRTSFHWEDLDRPQQVVHRKISIDIESYDWRGLSSWEQELKLRQSLREDRYRGFDLTKPPLLRLLLFRSRQDSYYLVFSHHHILLDGWSHPLLLAEVRTFYQANLQNQPLRLPKPRPYREYINWLKKQDVRSAEVFWRDYLGGITGPTSLPGDLGSDRQKGFQLHFDEWRTTLSQPLYKALQGVARKCHVTLNTIIFGAWAIILSRYSGQPDVVFGMLVSGRPPNLEGVESMIGMFINTLPMRITVDNHQPLENWFKQLQKQQSILQEYAFSPLMMVQSWSEIPRSVPLFGSVVDINNTPQKKLTGTTRTQQNDTTYKIFPNSVNQNFPLFLYISPVVEELSITLTYNARRFTSASIAQVAEQMRTLLTAIAQDLDQSLGDLPLMSSIEQNRVIFEWNQTQASYPKEFCLHQLFEAQVNRTPDATAIIFVDQQITYRQLNEQANQLAHHLRGVGVSSGTLVGLCLERSVAMIIGLLAILKAGGAYIPLDPNYPVARLQFMLQDAKPDVLLTDQHLLSRLGKFSGQTVCFNRDQALWQTQPTENLENLTQPDDLAYVLYTSGSTGRPKGILGLHRGAVNRLTWMWRTYPFAPGEVTCQKTSLNFVDSVWELFGPLLQGIPTVLVPQEVLIDPHRLVQTLGKHQVTRIVLVPSLLSTILETTEDIDQQLPKLKIWISSGETLRIDLLNQFRQSLPNRVLLNLYGSSEVSADVTCYDTQTLAPDATRVPIGQPIANSQIYLLDQDLQPVPIGIPGELYAGGDGLARGYLNRSDLTAERFIPNPFSDEVGARLYKTGDLARYLPDGILEYLGRIDHQVKIRGIRIELEEIESVLRQYNAIRQVAVTVTEGEQLVAHIVIENGIEFKLDELREFLHNRLPEAMIPGVYLTLDTLPLTPSGKVDRRTLSTPKPKDLDQSRSKDTASVLPKTPTEKVIARIWAEMLPIKKINTESDFFHLGGHSLLAALIASRLSKVLKTDVPITSLLEARTLGNLAKWIDTSKAEGISQKTQIIPDLTRADRGKIAPLSFPQQRMWFLDQLNPGSLSYTVGHFIRFTGELNVEALRLALTEIVRRHQSLRTTFIARNGEPFQVIHDNIDIPLPVIDLTQFSEHEREAIAQDYGRKQAREPWDLVNGPLFRAKILRISPENNIFALTMHHIITDGRSLGVFSQELAVLYEAFLDGRSSPLPNLPIQYADFAIWQRDWLKGDHFSEQLNYWQTKLAGISPLELPLDRPRPSVHRYQGGRQSFQLSSPVVKQLQELAQTEGATMFMVLLAGFQLLLSRYSGQDDISVGTPVANRSQDILNHLIGFFVNTLVMRTDLCGNPTLRQLLGVVKRTCLDAYNHQDLPFDKLVEVLNPQRDLSWNPLFQVMFVHQTATRSAVDVSGLSWQHQGGAELETSNFDLLLIATERKTTIECTLQYNSDLFDAVTVERMAAHLKLLFERSIANVDRPLSEISLLSEAEQKQLLLEWNGVSEQPEVIRCIHELIEERSQQNPESTAVCFQEQTLSYGELNRRSNQLARYLQRLGIGTENIVGCCFERSPLMLIALLGTLKAGGAFLCLDPGYPRERLEYMLEDASVSTVLTQQHLQEAIPDGSHQLLCLDSEWEKIAEEQESPLESPVTPHNLAYVVYTSGSTGLPKGVMVEHQGLTNVICAQIPLFGITPESRVLQMLSISFDAALGEIFRTLVAGATLFLAPKDELLPGPSLIALIQKYKITTLTMPVATLGALPSVSEQLPDLQTLTVGGEVCLPELAARWNKGRRLINGYGPTETTIGATLATEWNSERKPPLGKPLANVKVYVLDPWMQPVAVGIPGELYIGGSGVARGYLNRPDLTAERFIPDPFSESHGDRLYRTGDLVRWLSDGNLDFLGRIDQQVKIRGFRIELGEIESVLSQHEQVGQAVVTVYAERGVQRLVGYVTPKNNENPSSLELREFLKARLPDYMIPAFFMVLASLPVTANGKVDRKALPAPNVDELTAETAFVPPQTETEKVLADIWSNVLGLEQVGIHSNFFELGGDSIMSIQIVARATDAGLPLTAKDLFEHQTIAELAQVVNLGEVIETELDIVTGEVPLTSVQQWFFSQNRPNPHYFNQWLTIEVPSNVNPNRLRQALKHILEHHDALRSQFTQSETGWQQRIAPSPDQVPLVEIDLSQLSTQEQQQGFEDKVKELQTSLNLSQGLLVRMAWFYLGSRQPGYLVLIIHHLVTDNVSWPILMDDLMKVYGQLQSEQPVHLPRKTTSFKQWAEALASYADSDSLKNEAPYWLNLRNLDIPQLPLDHPSGVNTKASMDTLKISLNQEETQVLLQDITGIYQAKIHEILLAVLALVICRWTGGNRTLINIEGHGREDIGAKVNISRTVGWFTSFYPLLLEVDNAKELKEIIKSLNQQFRQVPNRGIGYSVLRYLTSDENIRDQLSQIPPTQIAFNYTGGQIDKSPTGGQMITARKPQELMGSNTLDGTLGQIRLAESSEGNRRHLLEIVGSIMHGQLFMRWAYSSNLHEASTINEIGNDFLTILRELINEK